MPWKEKRQKERPKWWTREVGKLCGRKRRAWIEWKKKKKVEDRREYERLEKKVKKQSRTRNEI